MFFPVVGKASEGVDAGEAYSGLVVPELFGGRGVAVSELACVRAMCVPLGEELFAVGVDASEDGTGQGQNGDGRLDDVVDVDRLTRTLGAGRVGEQVVHVVVEDEAEGADDQEGERCHDPDGPKFWGVPASQNIAAPPK